MSLDSVFGLETSLQLPLTLHEPVDGVGPVAVVVVAHAADQELGRLGDHLARELGVQLVHQLRKVVLLQERIKLIL